VNCRHCGSPLDLPFLDLGTAPPSNAYLSEKQLTAPETWYPLRLLVCRSCWLVQTEDYAGRETLFTDDYAYFSSFSSSWLAHAERYINEMVRRFELAREKKSTVVEVAANDGYLLQYVQSRGIDCYGIEPTQSTAEAARAKGIKIVEDFFGVHLAHTLVHQGRNADLIVANNVLAHVPDINDFVAGFTHLLKTDGVATFEFPHLLQMVSQNQFDTAYHEHYSYLSLTTVSRIFTGNGLQVFDVQELPSHGGSLRVFVQREDTGKQPQSPSVANMFARESSAGMFTESFYKDFQYRAINIKNELLSFLIRTKQQGKKVGAYGAAAKGNTLLNFAGIRSDLLPWVVDRNPAKQGRYLPGSRISIVDEEYLHDQRPDFVLVLPWNLWDEVIEQLKYIRDWNGRFIRAVPELEVI
jgi:SAM-dependent methyltransferase